MTQAQLYNFITLYQRYFIVDHKYIIVHILEYMILKEVENLDSSEFKQSIKIYKYSFPVNETRPADKIVDMLRNDQDYHLFISLNNELVIGMSLMYVFSSLRMGLLDYMAVIPNLRGQGNGNNLNFTLKFRSIVSNGVDLMMEVQKDNARNLQEGTLRKKRIKFYLQLGGKILDCVNYLLPPLRYGVDPEKMYLIMKPLKQINLFIKTKYHCIYRSGIFHTLSMSTEGSL